MRGLKTACLKLIGTVPDAIQKLKNVRKAGLPVIKKTFSNLAGRWPISWRPKTKLPDSTLSVKKERKS